jgi:hypothetical protein
MLVGGDVVTHDMAVVAMAKNPCGPAREKFEPRTWDERSNFEPNPNPCEQPPELRFGLDLMGVPRKFDIDWNLSDKTPCWQR